MMCRWLAYLGTPLALEELLFNTEHSLIDQSLRARISTETTNGDGFGVGWYDNKPSPGLYRDIQPAWNNGNLRDLAAHIESGLFLAHVRAATGTTVQQSNCHPFRYGKWLFVHNGVIRGFEKIRRQLVLEVAADLFPCIRGTTDSEVMFFLALTYGLESDWLGALQCMAGVVEQVGRENGVEHPLQMTLGLADGRRHFAVRYSSERQSRSLYLSVGGEALREVHPRLHSLSDNARAVVSEPLSDTSESWQEIPESTALLLSCDSVELHDFVPTLPRVPQGNRL